MTLAGALDEAARILADAGIEAARGDARVLLLYAAGLTPAALVADPARPLGPDAGRRLADLVRRRAAREPVSHLLGRREFWSRDFIVGPAVLDPRPDSETLIEAALDLLPAGRAADVLDLGVGSGCLLLTVLAERPLARGVGIDLSADAVGIARQNAARLGVADRARFCVGDWGAPLDAAFDLILCNPPYVASGDLGTLAPEVAVHEPRLALDGGPDGLAAYRALAGPVARLLAPAGHALIEAGESQIVDIIDIFCAQGCRLADRKHDLAGIARCAVFAPPDRAGGRPTR